MKTGNRLISYLVSGFIIIHSWKAESCSPATLFIASMVLQSEVAVTGRVKSYGWISEEGIKSYPPKNTFKAGAKSFGKEFWFLFVKQAPAG